MKYKIVQPNGYHHPYFKDLTHNFNYILTEGTKDVVQPLDSNYFSECGKDYHVNHTDYSHLQTFEELLDSIEDITQIPEDRQFTVSIKQSQFYSSDKESSNGETGFDRPRDRTVEEWNRYLKKHDGYRASKAQSIGIKVRWRINEDGIAEITGVKFLGNGRNLGLFLATHGKDSLMQANVSFHQEKNIDDWGKMKEVEAIDHKADATDRSNQNEDQRFYSGIAANEPEYTYCLRKLIEHKVEYSNILKRDYPEIKINWEIKSIMGLKDGQGNKLFRKYTEKCVDNAFEAITNMVKRDKAREVVKVKDAKIIFNSILWILSSLYYHFSVIPAYKANGKTYQPFFIKDDIDDFLNKWIDFKMEKDIWTGLASDFDINRIGKNADIKNIEYLMFNAFYVDLVRYYKSLKMGDSKTDVKGFGINCNPVQVVLNSVSPILKSQLKSLVINS